MYKEFFKLKNFPFSMAPDASCVFLTMNHREAIAGLAFSILNRKGFFMLTGDAGTGKTTVLSRVLKYLPAGRVQSSMILHPTLSRDEFLEMMLLDFGISEIPDSKARRIAKLHSFIMEAHRNGKISALIVDEAHKLSPDVLEEIRLLGNQDAGDQKLLQIILAGQTELDDLFRREEMRQLKQRIAVRVSLKPLQDQDVSEYIRFRWKNAGGTDRTPFTADAIEQIRRKSKGVPRLINSICDNALVIAFAGQSTIVEASHVLEAAADLDLIIATPTTHALPPAPIPEVPRRPPVMTDIPAIRVPEFAADSPKSSLLNRFAAKFGLT